MANDEHGSLPRPPPPPPCKCENASLGVAEHLGKLATPSTAQGHHVDSPTAPALHSGNEKEQPDSQQQGSSSAGSAAQDQGSSLAVDPNGMPLDPYLLVKVLSYLPPQQYLSSCSLVCHAWHAAAAQAAAQEVVIDSGPDSLCSWHEQLFTLDRRASFALWLCKHGFQVQRLRIDAGRSRPRPVWSLLMGQLQRLQRLELVNCQLTLMHDSSSIAHHPAAAAAAAVPHKVCEQQQQQQQQQHTLHCSAYSSNCNTCQASLTSLTSLTSLSLQDVDCPSGGLADLSALTNLQLLRLAGTSLPPQQQQQQQQHGDDKQQQQVQQQLGFGFLSPLTQLTQLALDIERLPVDAANLLPCLYHVGSLTRLRSLRLQGLPLQKQQVLRELAALTNLKVLELVGGCAYDLLQEQHVADDHHHDQQQQQQQHAADGHHHEQQQQRRQQQQHAGNKFGSISALTQLTQLDLHAVLLPAAAAEALACLQHLQVLRVYHGKNADAAAMACLPKSVTQLSILWGDELAPFGSTSVPALASLPALQVLDVYAQYSSGGLSVGLCSSMLQLRKLRLRGAFQSALSHDLLDVVPHLPDLDELSITVCDFLTAPDRPQPLTDLSRYSGLLASTPNLMQLSFMWLFTCMLPFGCGQHLFAAGVQLPQLKQLVLGAPRALSEFFSEDHWGFHAIEACFGPGDVARLVRCCPALELLSIPGLVQPGVDMSPLTSLTRLRQLSVGGQAIDDETARLVFAQLPQLKHLEVCGAPKLTDAGVYGLSLHTGLTELLLVGCGLSSAMPITPCGGFRADGAKCFRVRQQGAGGLVYMQLLELCSHSDALNWEDRAAACDRLLAHKRERKYGVSGPMIGSFMVRVEHLLWLIAFVVPLTMRYARLEATLAAWGGAASYGTYERWALYVYLFCFVPACALFAWVVQVHVLMLVTGGWRAGWLCSTRHDWRCHLVPAALAAWWPAASMLPTAIPAEVFFLSMAFASWIRA